MNTCSNCGQKFEGSFCPNCGEKAKAPAPAAPASAFCPNCGSPLNGAGAFCPKCGKALNAPAQRANNAAPRPAQQPYAAPVQQPYQPMQSMNAMPPAAGPNGAPAGGARAPYGAPAAPGAHGIMPYPPAESKFTGGAFGRFGVNFLVIFVSLITLSLALPAMICFKQRYLASRTFINGRKMYFDGKAMQLIGKYIVWLLLSIVTCGIYLLFLTNRMEKWVTSHKHFEGVQGGVSKFTGGAIVYFFVNLWALIVTIITLTFGMHWATCFRQRWKKKHTYIDGHRLYFDGKAIQLFGKRICWGLLTIITFGIFFFWYRVKELKWITYHTHAEINIDPAVPQEPANRQAAPAGNNGALPPAGKSAPDAGTQAPAGFAAGAALATAAQAEGSPNAFAFSAPADAKSLDEKEIAEIRAQFPTLNVKTSSLQAEEVSAQTDGPANAQTSDAKADEKNDESAAASMAVSAEVAASKNIPDAENFDFVNGIPVSPAEGNTEQAAQTKSPAEGETAPANADAAPQNGAIAPAHEAQSAAETPAAQGTRPAGKMISVAAILYAIPAAAFFLLSIFFFLFMTGSVSKDLFGADYYDLPDLHFAVSAANMSIACTSLLLVASLLFGAFALYSYLKKTEPRAWKLPVRWFFEGVCALFTLLVFIAACIILGKLGKYEASAGAAPVLCLVFALLFLGGIATAEVFFTKSSASLGFASATAKETFRSAVSEANKKFIHPDLREDGIFAIEKEENEYKNDHKIGEALAYANKGAARRNIWSYVIAIVFCAAALFFAIGWGAWGNGTPVYLFAADLILSVLLLAAVIVCLVFTSSERKNVPVGEQSGLAYIKARKKNALKLAICSAALMLLSIICMITVNALVRNVMLTCADAMPLVIFNFYFLRTVSQGLGEIFLYYAAVFTMFVGGLKAFADLRRFRAYGYAVRELSKSFPDENAPLGARWAMLKNALRENSLAAGKKIKFVKGGKQDKTITPRFRRFFATATSAVLCLAVFLCVMPAVQNSNESLGNAENLAIVYNNASAFGIDTAELFFGEPYEENEETGTSAYYSKNYQSVISKAEDLEKRMIDGEISMEKYITEVAKLTAKLASMTYRRVTVTETRVYSEVIRGENIFGDAKVPEIDWVKVATREITYPKSFGVSDLKAALTEEVILNELKYDCFYTAKFSDGSIEIAKLNAVDAEILSVTASSVRVKLDFITSDGQTEKTTTIRLRKSETPLLASY